MNPVLPDGETVWSRLGIGPHGRAWQTIHDAWPQVRADIDAGHPSPLGLVTVKSSDPWQLKHDHQVLAYGYELDEGILALSVYDPNLPGRDDVRLSLSIADPWHLDGDDDAPVGETGLRLLPGRVRGRDASLAGLRGQPFPTCLASLGRWHPGSRTTA